jgi:hypothetical protein
MSDSGKMLQVLADDFEGFLAVVSAAAKFPSVVEKVNSHTLQCIHIKQSHFYERENRYVNYSAIAD